MITILDTNDNYDSVCFFFNDSHYCDKSLSIIVTIPSKNLLVSRLSWSTRGTDTSAEGLRNVPRGIVAIYQSFLSRSSRK